MKKLRISRMNVTIMSAMLSGITKEAMVLVGNENEAVLKQVIK